MKDRMSNGKKKRFLQRGKLRIGLLREIFEEYNTPEILKELKKQKSIEAIYKNAKERVKMGFAIGEDAGVIDMGEQYLVAKTDPITFATDEIGYYVVNVNANDVAAMGAVPKWFQATILLPESSTTAEMAKDICIDIQRACLNIGVVLIGGHTEVTYDLKRPIIVGSMLGEVNKDNYVETGGAKPGDAIICTKSIPIEGTSIIAREKEIFLKEHGISEKIISKAKSRLHEPGISIIKEAILASKNFNIHTMHDPTEGGLAMGLVEMALASNCGFEIRWENIPIILEGKILCDFFNLNILNTISSGSLLIGVEEKDCEPLLALLKKNGIRANKIGNFSEEKKYKIEIDGQLHDLIYSETDEITKIFNN
ncbi:MAG: AIR synthase-related protein [Promethearchaeota archaeon]